MRQFKKLFSFLTILCLLAGSATTVSASGTTPHIKFTNESTDSTDLRIAKTVTGTGYPEHVKFRFKLKLDLNGDGTADRLSEPLTYTVSDRDGQIVRKSGGRVVEFTTDSNGIFELEDGQTATFKKVGTVAYEVTEESDYRRPKMEKKPGATVETPVIDPSVSYYRRTVRKEEGKDDVITDTELRPEYVYELRAMAKDGYTLTSPTGGNSGNVTAGMETIVFTNRYTDPSTASTVLRVRKTVSYPTEYALPDAVKEAQFWFRLETADTKVRQYTVENPVSETVDTVRLTDEEGYFYLYAGETAAFAEMKPTDAWRVYEIVEAPEGAKANKVCPAAWWPTGRTMQQGNTVPADPVIFNNSNTALRVSKTMDEDPDPNAPVPEFTFQLLDARGNPMTGKTYYRYNMMSGALVLNGDKQTWTTGEQGYFRLKRNEEAVFCGFTADSDGTAGNGIRPNTSVTVKEIGRVIVDANGQTKIDSSYAEQPSQTRDIPKTGAIVSVDFVNTRVEVEGTLTVTKYVENATEEGSGADSDFHFILSKKQVKDGVETYVPVNNAFFEFGPEGAKQNLATGDRKQGWEDGEFTIKAGETAKFTRLLVDTEYKVEEVKLTSEYKPKNVEPKPDGSYEYFQEGKLTENGSLGFTFTNVYTPKKVNLTIKKVDDQGNPLPGADFMLYLVEGKGNGADNTDNMVLPEGKGGDYRYTTPDSGTVAIDNLKPDTYWLYEEKAPSGYRLLQTPLEIQIEQTVNGLQVKIDGVVYSVGDTSVTNNDKLTNVKVTAGSTGADGKDINGVVELTIPNLYLYELPNSGGIGIYWYSIGGVLLMMAAALILYRKNIRRRGC